MKSLKFEDLRGTNTAIQPELEQVPQFYKGMEIIAAVSSENHTKGCPYIIYDIANDGKFLSITTNTEGYLYHIHSIEFFNYFGLKAKTNTEPNPDLTGTRPAIEWLQYLPDGYRDLALEAVNVAPLDPNIICQYNQCIYCAISWMHTKEKDVFWSNVNDHLQDPSNPLPPLPSEGEKTEIKPEKSQLAQALNQNNMSDTLTPSEKIEVLNGKIFRQEKSLQLMVDLHDKLQGKIESLEKRLSEIAPKTINAEPIESNPVKLPVTIEEVWEEETKKFKDKGSFMVNRGGDISESFFSETKLIREFRKEPTAKKSRAFDTLLKIAEAQNEIVPRGEQVYCAYFTGKEIIIDSNRILSYGQIPFHSEQGLRDCIEANKELWMNLLKGE